MCISNGTKQVTSLHEDHSRFYVSLIIGFILNVSGHEVV
jgi:hypothetical protein